MADDPTETHELLVEQATKEQREEGLLDGSDLPDEAEQHERRREKAEYLKEKLAERERSEVDAED